MYNNVWFKRNKCFATNSNFLIPIYLQPCSVVDLCHNELYMNDVRSSALSLEY